MIYKLIAFVCLVCTSVCWSNDQEYQFKGTHFLVSYCDCDNSALTNLDQLKESMTAAVEASGATVLDVSSWVFPPSGLTMVFLLSESHASIHTYPEHNACFVDLFTCGENCSAEKFDAVMQAYLKPKTVNHQMLIRNKDGSQ